MSLYYHIRVLERTGIVRECATRKGRRQTEALYDLVATDFIYDVETPLGERNIQRVCAALLRMTQRDLRRTVAGGAFSALIEDGRATAGRRTGWMTTQDVARVMHHLGEIKKLIGRAGPRPKARRYSCTMFVLPLENKGNDE